VDHERCCDLLADEVERVAGAVAEVRADAAVPSCPDWNVGDLALHLGRVHRWADGLVAALAEGPQVAADAFDDLHDIGLKELFLKHRDANTMDFVVGAEIYDHLEKVADRFDDVANEINSIVIEQV